MKILFNDQWLFRKVGIDTPECSLFNEGVWQEIDVPHDWMIYDVQHLHENSIGCYKKRFNVISLRDDQLFLRFDGVYMDTTIYLNQKKIFEWKYGYSRFEVDLTDLVIAGENELWVKCEYRCPNSRWYSGAGIYRNVWLIQKPQAYLVSDGSYLSTKPNGEIWEVEIDIEAIAVKEPIQALIEHSITDAEGKEVAYSEEEVSLSHAILNHKRILNVFKPRLWDVEDPYLYHMTSKLIVQGKIWDEKTQNLGFRQFRVDSNEGFFLNGRSIKIQGACQHHDLGALGSAFNEVALRRQFETLKEMGINAIRTAHNMPAAEVMDIADEMGLLIYTEAFDMWESCKTDYDYGLYFKEWWEKDLRSWVRRDRNHPSLIFWGIGNEIYDTRFERGKEIAQRLNDAVRNLDPRRNGLTAIGSNYIEFKAAQQCSEVVEVSGYNYKESLYDRHHAKYPHWCIFGSETSSTVQSRGVYHFPLSNRLLTYDDGQCSCLGNCTTNWGAKNVDEVIVNHRDRNYCFGQFIWSGWDYIGEPTPYFSKNSFFGQIDTAGFKKDTFYHYQAEWVPYQIKPMIHILPYWDFNEGQLIDVCIYSNAPIVELCFNGKSLGKQEIDHVHGKKLQGIWQLPYQKGVLKAIAYDKEGNVLITEEQSSFTDPVKIMAKPNKTKLLANGEDLIFVEISTVDQEGIEVANGRSRMQVKVTGAGRLVGLDNGDSTDYEEYKGTSRKLFSGKLLAIIAAKKEAGWIEVEVTSPELEKAYLKLEAIPSEMRTGVSALIENKPSPHCDEIPVRKIELSCLESRVLDQSHKEVVVTAKIYPENATYRDVVFKAITLEGIESNSVSIKVEGLKARLIAKGDGAFRLCASSHNGRALPEVISELEFEVVGMGKANLDPYGLVSGCKCSTSSYPTKVSFQGGAFLDTTNEAIFTFEDVDFGEFGSDEMTIPIFSFQDEFPIQVWQGTLEEGECLVTDYYRAKSWYNHYQANTYKLSKRLKGLQTLTIALWPGERISLQGFSFTKLNKATQKLYGSECNRVTGDCFHIEERAITQIGNNVTIEYHHMDFGEEGVEGIKLYAHSFIPVQTIQIHFIDEKGNSQIQSIEIPFSESYQEWAFPLEKVKGKKQVNLIFLPGSKLDLEWIWFIKENQ